MFPIIETFLVTLLFSVSDFSESRRKVKKLTNLLATHFHSCVCWTGFTKTWVSVVKIKIQTDIFLVLKENPYQV